MPATPPAVSTPRWSRQLLVAGMRFVVGRPELLDDGLQVTARGRQFCFQLAVRRSGSLGPPAFASSCLPFGSARGRRPRDQKCRPTQARDRRNATRTACVPPGRLDTLQRMPTFFCRASSTAAARASQVVAQHAEQIHVGFAARGQVRPHAARNSRASRRRTPPWRRILSQSKRSLPLKSDRDLRRSVQRVVRLFARSCTSPCSLISASLLPAQDDDRTRPKFSARLPGLSALPSISNPFSAGVVQRTHHPVQLQSRNIVDPATVACGKPVSEATLNRENAFPDWRAIWYPVSTCTKNRLSRSGAMTDTVLGP